MLGKGRPFQEHPGNMRLHALVDQLLPEYDKLGTKEKTELAYKIVQSMRPGRFLSQECGVWMEVAQEISREKVSHLFRARRKALVRKQKKERQEQQLLQQKQYDPLIIAMGGAGGGSSSSHRQESEAFDVAWDSPITSSLSSSPSGASKRTVRRYSHQKLINETKTTQGEKRTKVLP